MELLNSIHLLTSFWLKPRFHYSVYFPQSWSLERKRFWQRLRRVRPTIRGNASRLLCFPTKSQNKSFRFCSVGMSHLTLRLKSCRISSLIKKKKKKLKWKYYMGPFNIYFNGTQFGHNCYLYLSKTLWHGVAHCHRLALLPLTTDRKDIKGRPQGFKRIKR